MSCWFKQGKTFNEPVCQFCFGSTNQLLSFQNDEGENISVLEWRDKHFIKRRFPTFSIRIQSFEDDHINSYYLGDLIQLVIDLWLPQNESPVHQHYQIVHIIIVGGYSLLHHFHYHHVFDSLVRPYVPMQCLLRRLVIHPASILLRVWHLRHNFLVTLHCVEKTVLSNRIQQNSNRHRRVVLHRCILWFRFLLLDEQQEKSLAVHTLHYWNRLFGALHFFYSPHQHHIISNTLQRFETWC